jgi:hypothetical protein
LTATNLLVLLNAAAIIGMIKNALLPIYEPDRVDLRAYCTKAGCGMGLKVLDKKTGQMKLKPPMMSAAEFANKPASFAHKYCRHWTPSIEEQLRRLDDIPRYFAALRDPSAPGELLFREGGPVLKAFNNLKDTVRSGKLQGG